MRAAVLVLALAACSDPPREAVIDASCTGTGGPRVLVFNRETLWMHPATLVARDALLAMCASHGFSVTVSADPAVFDDGHLDTTDTVVFALSSGNVLDPPSRVGFEAWVRAGGGVVGLHSASATEYDWPFFMELVGVRFRTHPPALIEADVTVEDPTDPIVADLPLRWRRTDEWYSFEQRPEDLGLHVVLAVDETSAAPAFPTDQTLGLHAVAWTHTRFGGRMFYTAMGHTEASYADPQFLAMIARAIVWTAD